MPSRKHFIQHHAERPDIGAPIHIAASELFRRHVAGGSDRGSRLGQPRDSRTQRQPEIQDAGVPLGVHDDVVALDIAMDDSHLVRLVQAAGDLEADIDRLANGQRPPGDLSQQRLALQVCHGDKGLALDFFHVIDRANVWMPDHGGRLRLIDQSLAVLLGEHVGQQKLQRNGPLQALIFGLEHLAHAAFAKRSDDPVTRDRIAALDHASVRASGPLPQWRR